MGRPIVLLDLRMVRGIPHGIARYASALARELPAVAPDLQFVALQAAGQASVGIPGKRALFRFLSLAEQVEVPLRSMRCRASLFHATSFAVPRFSLTPLVLTLHDAIHLAVPEESSALKRAYYRRVVRPAAQRARALVTVSRFSRDELSRRLQIDPARFQVIPNGIDERFRPPAAAEVARIRLRYRLPERFALYVGNLKPHKNASVLLEAARILGNNLPVVFAGDNDAHSKLAPAPSDAVRSLGAVSDDDLPGLYAASSVFVFPSTYEGAGLPPLEAMACGVPVISSKSASMPELLGDAAEYFDPSDPRALAHLAQLVADDAPGRVERIARGRAHAARYTWQACAQATAELYRQALARA
jgi:glycosyltransferase involved in cell wall biosynthesis